MLTKFGKLGMAGVDTRALFKLTKQTGALPAVFLVGEEDEQLNTGITFEAVLVRANNKEEINFWDRLIKVDKKLRNILSGIKKN